MALGTKTFSNAITFTRASNATYFDSSGILRQASSNASRIDYNPDTLAIRGMLVEEQRTNLFLYSESVDIMHTSWAKGNNIIRIGREYLLGRPATIYQGDGSGANEYVTQPVSVTTGVTYVVSVYARLVSGTKPTAGNLITIETTPGSSSPRTSLSFSSISLTSTVARYSIAFTATGTGLAYIYFAVDQNNTAQISLMGAQVEVGTFPTSYTPSSVTFSGRTSIGTYYDSTGLVRKASSGVSRLNYSPINLNYDPFLLLEPSRTNPLTYSEDFNNAAWTKTRCSVVPNATTAPNGSVSADKIVEDTSASTTHAVTQTATGLTGGATYTQTVYVKSAERSRVVIGGWDGTTGIDCTFSLSSGTVVASGAGTIASSIESVGSGWYRCRVTRAIAAAATFLQFVIYTSDPTNNVYTGDGVSGLFIWGAQIEAGSYPTSYIPSTVTFSGRTSDGTYFDSTGTLATASSGVARTTYNPANLSADPFLLLEESRTNRIRNNTMVGAAAGTPGTLPTNWAASTALTGLTREIVGTGTESGITYIDVRLNGTPSAAGRYDFFYDTSTAVAALNGQTWTNSGYFKLQAGTLTGVTAVRLYFEEKNSGGSYLTEQNIAITNPTSAALNTQRASATRTLNQATTAFLLTGVNLLLTGAAIDITLRVGMPQLELGAYATSVITTSSVAVTRSADTSTSAAATRSADTSSSASATRSADTASVSAINPWYNPIEGTLYAEGILVGGTPSTYPCMASFVGSDVNLDSIVINWTANSGGMRWGIRVGGAQQADIGFGPAGAKSAGSSFKVAGRYATNDFQVASDGIIATADTSGFVPNIVSLLLGGAATYQPVASVYLRRIVYYPTRLTDAQLQALTT